MFSKEDEKWKPFSDLTDIMENAGSKHPPDNFTAKIMTRLSAEKETTQVFSFTQTFFPSIHFGFHRYVSKTECAFYFFLAGFFYLILGLIMVMGMPLPVVMENNRWLSVQPFFGILLAVQLIAIGLVFFKKGNSAIRIVRMGTTLYAALVILNFWMGTLYVQFSVVILYISIFSLAGLSIAYWLGLAIDYYQLFDISSEVRG